MNLMIDMTSLRSTRNREYNRLIERRDLKEVTLKNVLPVQMKISLMKFYGFKIKDETTEAN